MQKSHLLKLLAQPLEKLNDSSYKKWYEQNYKTQFAARTKNLILFAYATDSAFLIRCTIDSAFNVRYINHAKGDSLLIQTCELTLDSFALLFGFTPSKEAAGTVKRANVGYTWLIDTRKEQIPEIPYEKVIPLIRSSILTGMAGKQGGISEKEARTFYTNNIDLFPAIDTVEVLLLLSPEFHRSSTLAKAQVKKWVGMTLHHDNPFRFSDEHPIFRSLVPGDTIGPMSSWFGQYWLIILTVRKGRGHTPFSEVRPTIEKFLSSCPAMVFNLMMRISDNHAHKIVENSHKKEYLESLFEQPRVSSDTLLAFYKKSKDKLPQATQEYLQNKMNLDVVWKFYQQEQEKNGFSEWKKGLTFY